MNDLKQNAEKRLNYQILLMKKHMQKHQISNAEVSRLIGVDTKTIWRFINRKSKGGNSLTFLMIAEAIGFEININLK